MNKNTETTAYLISIGDELLIGQVKDTNASWIAEQLTGLGVSVKKIMAVQDEETHIIEALKEGISNADLVLTTGGLGPTVDDITKNTFAKFMDVEMVFNQEFYNKVKAYVEMRGGKIKEMLHDYSYFPKDTIFLKNSVGSAPGMLFKKNNSTIISMPGVPPEMKSIFTEEIIPLIKILNGDNHIVKKTILTAGELEAVIADNIDDIASSMPKNMSIAYLPNLGRVRIRITAKGKDQNQLEKLINKYSLLIENKIGDIVFGYNDETLEQVVGNILIDKKMTLGSAESCTGGMIAHMITSVSGSSAYYKGSIVAYANEIKKNVLGVDQSTLEMYGAVSEQTAIEMVKGTLKQINCDVAISTTGIAGPTGGTKEKPVGTIWLACGTNDKIVTTKLQLGKNRVKNIETSTILALNMLRKFLLSKN